MSFLAFLVAFLAFPEHLLGFLGFLAFLGFLWAHGWPSPGCPWPGPAGRARVTQAPMVRPPGHPGLGHPRAHRKPGQAGKPGKPKGFQEKQGRPFSLVGFARVSRASSWGSSSGFLVGFLCPGGGFSGFLVGFHFPGGVLPGFLRFPRGGFLSWSGSPGFP